jgi:hypothetical protein
MAEFPDDLYKVNISDFVCYITPEEAQRIAEQFCTGKPLLDFVDVVGSRTLVPIKDFKGMWQTNAEMRAAGTRHLEELKAECDKPWED